VLEKNYKPAFLADKIFTDDKNSNRSLDREILAITIKIPHSLTDQFKIRQKATEYTKHSVSKTVHYHIYILK
jgi:hypothetical protein